jgi:hypothetical protein
VSNLVDRRIQAVLDIQRQLVDEHRSLDDTVRVRLYSPSYSRSVRSLKQGWQS